MLGTSDNTDVGWSLLPTSIHHRHHRHRTFSTTLLLLLTFCLLACHFNACSAAVSVVVPCDGYLSSELNKQHRKILYTNQRPSFFCAVSVSIYPMAKQPTNHTSNFGSTFFFSRAALLYCFCTELKLLSSQLIFLLLAVCLLPSFAFSFPTHLKLFTLFSSIS